MIVLTHTVLGGCLICMCFIFCTCTCSAQLSMFDKERRASNIFF